MDLGSKIFLGSYFTILAGLAIFGWHRYYLVYLYYRHRKVRAPGVPAFAEMIELPMVTVQLPVYNEKYVVERLVAKICALEYPKDRLEIQLLDDSTDETRQISEQVVARFQKLGHPIVHLHRKNRQGYKAGALNEGLKVAKGQYIAVFDADFLPESDFLQKMIPYFYGEKKYGMVQARWGHLNQDYSLMTQAQSVLLDGHFVIEHTARNRSGRFFNFNGTAGIWDRDCIADSGGWQFDTLTEDLDLSYRAQLKGWQFLYLPEIVVPAELPVDMNGFKCQQHRWAKGSIQTALKLMPRILKSEISWKIKLESCIHLLNNFAYVLIILLSLMLPLSVFIRHHYQLGYSLFIDLPVFILATFSMGTFYACSQREIYPDWKLRLLYLPLNLALGIGLAVNNTKAVVEALLRKESPFNRTAKYAIGNKEDRWAHKKYKSNVSLGTWIEIFLGIYFTGAVIFAIFQGMWATLYCLLMFQLGFLYVGLLSMFQGRSFVKISPNLDRSTLPAE